jgi:DNA-directed RNA polymerase subunit N (RpoN/RPB10)
MCGQTISNSSDLFVDIVNTIDDQIDKFDEIGII